MAVIVFRRVSVCKACGELKLEGEPLHHIDRVYGGVCSLRNHRDDWRRVQGLVLLQSNVHQEVRWLVNA